MLRVLAIVLVATPLAVFAQAPGSRAIVDPGTGPWQAVPADEVATVCRLDHGLLRGIAPPEGAAFAVIRYGRLCFVSGDGPSAGNQVAQAFSATKTLGATLTGMVMYQTRDLPASKEFGKGPLREFDRADRWIDLGKLGEGGDIHPDATIAHGKESEIAAAPDHSRRACSRPVAYFRAQLPGRAPLDHSVSPVSVRLTDEALAVLVPLRAP